MVQLLNLSGVRYRIKKSASWMLNEVNLTVEPGELVVISGRSGSGKTALVELIYGLRKPFSGHVETVQPIALVTQAFSLYSDLTVMENLEFIGAINGVSSQFCQEVITRTGLAGFEKVRAAHLTAGHQRMLQVAAGLLNPAQLMLLDEWDSGLDPIQQATVTELCTRLSLEGKGILLTSSREYPELGGSHYRLEDGRLIRKDFVPEEEMRGGIGS
ncbi:MAG TPA: ATP-binding cassette domain-containing protein [Bacillota bacterium]|nr:ATP-binding cassette domain-containing protein [Bacillota bacterium]